MGKKLRRALWVFAFCLLWAFQAGAAEMGTVTASALTLRAGPGTDYGIVFEIPFGSRLEILEYIDGWYKVLYDETVGAYVSARYVRLDIPSGGIPSATQPLLPSATASPGSGLVAAGNNPAYPMVMKVGDSGNSVIDLQTTLDAMGYPVTIDGVFGEGTLQAVMQLQSAWGLEADGVVGAQTRRMVGGSGSGKVEFLDWWKGGNLAYARFAVATVTDVRTGRSFQITRYGGDNHYDCEPASAQDAQTILSIYGGQYSWNRRPVWVTVNGRVLCGSMNGMPHEGQHNQNNNFNGHFCLHLYNSRTHGSNQVDPDHAACVREAWEKRGNYTAP